MGRPGGGPRGRSAKLPPGPTEHRWWIGRLAATPLRLRRLCEELTGDLASRAPKPGEWSAAEVVLHLVEGDRDSFVPRLRRMLAEDTPILASPRAARAADAALDPSVLLDVFAQARGQAVGLLEALGPDGWAVTLHEYATHVAEHDAEHLAQLESLRRAAAPGLPS